MPEPPAAGPVLAVRDLRVALPPGADRPFAVDGVGFDLDAGEILCVVGESGSGKSLTAAAIMRLLPRSVRVAGGTITLDGTDLLALPEAEMRGWRGRRLGMIFQEPMTALNPLMRVGDQIDEVLRAHAGLDEAARRRRVVELMAQVNLPDPGQLRHAYPFRLSGGQRQRVMIAMALALGPAVLIADEPTTALDVTTQKQILALIKEIQRRHGMGVLFITHDFGVVAEIADRVAVMQHGSIVEIGRAADVLNAPRHAYTRSLIAAVPRLEPRPAVANAAPTILEATQLSKTYASAGGFFVRRRVVAAVKRVDLVIREGETLGVVGESGSGKSTLGRLLVRLIKADGGTVTFGGTDLLTASAGRLRALRHEVQMVFQDPYASLNPRRRVGAIVADGPKAQGVDHPTAMARARELLALVGLDPAAVDRYPHEFSGGQRQRIGIARALALDPRLLIADEPVSALDVSVQAQVLELLNDVRRRFRLAMLFITHDLRVAAQVADRIAVMRLGEIVETGPTEEIFRAPRHPYTRELLDAVPGRAWSAAAAAP
ncbi:MAG: ABC transporter ATP-binding protein [Alphaproteobacteria bacterium]|nr:ABC transporter ATP-binding protein [Alphaproteobacteria bacterium]